jgi:hypothetical protein
VLLQAFYFEATANLTGGMLVKVDRMSMANSLEVRCPLLDHQLAELASTFPPAWKMKNCKGKRILIDALGDRLPPELLNRPKRGFAVSLAIWFRSFVSPRVCALFAGRAPFRTRGQFGLVVAPAGDGTLAPGLLGRLRDFYGNKCGKGNPADLSPDFSCGMDPSGGDSVHNRFLPRFFSARHGADCVVTAESRNAGRRVLPHVAYGYGTPRLCSDPGGDLPYLRDGRRR